MTTTSEPTIIADTSGLVSLATDTDNNHERAVEEAARLQTSQRTIMLPSAVFVETVNVLGKHSSHATALTTAQELRRPGGQFVWIETSAFIEKALSKFQALPEGVSLTDCLVMAVADHYQTLDIFGFDKQFKDAGYHRLKPTEIWKTAP